MSWGTPVILIDDPDTLNQSSYATASFSPGATGDWLIFDALNTKGSTADLPTTLTDSQGETWTQVKQGRFDNGTNFFCVTRWVLHVGANTSARTLTVGGFGANQTGCAKLVTKIPGGGVGSVLGSSGLELSNTATAVTVDTDVAPIAGSAMYAVVGVPRNPGAYTPETGWTELHDNGFATPAFGYETAYKLSADQSYRPTGTAGVHGAIITEFKLTQSIAANALTSMLTLNQPKVRYIVKANVLNLLALNQPSVTAPAPPATVGMLMVGDGGVVTSQGASNTFFGIGTDATNEMLGQSFLGVGNPIVGAQLHLTAQGTPTDGILLELLDTDVGTGTVLASRTLTAAQIVSGALNTFGWAPVTNTSGVTYYLRASRTGAQDASNYWKWAYNTTSVISGQGWGRSSGTWTGKAGDLRFTILDRVPMKITLLSPKARYIVKANAFGLLTLNQPTVQQFQVVATNVLPLLSLNQPKVVALVKTNVLPLLSLNAPVIRYVVKLPALPLLSLNSPKVTQTVRASALTSLLTLRTPTVRSIVALASPLVLLVLRSPAVTVGAATIAANKLTLLTLNAPAARYIVRTNALGLLTLRTPAVGQVVRLPALGLLTLRSPSVTVGPATITTQALALLVLRSPAVTTGPVSIAAQALGLLTLRTPAVRYVVKIPALGLLTLRTPRLAYVVKAPSLALGALQAPAVVPGAVTVATNALALLSLYSVTVGPPIATIRPPALALLALRTPRLVSTVRLAAPLGLLNLRTPTLAQVVRLPSIGLLVIRTPAVTSVVRLPALALLSLRTPTVRSVVRLQAIPLLVLRAPTVGALVRTNALPLLVLRQPSVTVGGVSMGTLTVPLLVLRTPRVTVGPATVQAQRLALLSLLVPRVRSDVRLQALALMAIRTPRVTVGPATVRLGPLPLLTLFALALTRPRHTGGNAIVLQPGLPHVADAEGPAGISIGGPRSVTVTSRRATLHVDSAHTDADLGG